MGPTYAQCLQKLMASHAIKLGVENSRKVAELLGNPQSKYLTVHIAGTNGKGSVVTKVAKCLRIKGFKVGTFTSPHIWTVRERIEVDGEIVTETEVIDLYMRVAKAAEECRTELTFFDICTLMAFLHFINKKCQWAVIETGLGGRFDSTNILEAPAASVITSIGFDHMHILGSTLSKIAMEKAGIIKSKCPVVVGPSVACHECVWSKAKEVDSEVVEVKASDSKKETAEEENNRIAAEVVQTVLHLELFPDQLKEGLSSRPSLRMQWLSEDEIANAHIRAHDLISSLSSYSDISSCLEINSSSSPSSSHLKTGGGGGGGGISSSGNSHEGDDDDGGISNTKKKLSHLFLSSPPPPAILLDVGHNETALERLCLEVTSRFQDIPVRFCVCLSNERTASMFQPIVNHFSFPLNNRLMGLHYLQADHPRVKSLGKFMGEVSTNLEITNELRNAIVEGQEEVASWRQLWENDDEKSSSSSSLSSILSAALIKASYEKSIIIVCGTFFMMKEAASALGISSKPTTDPIDMNEPNVSVSLMSS